MKNDVIRSFRRRFEAEPTLTAFAPGRVNLIGEHTDYNGGCVMPCAISLGTYCAARRRDDDIIRLFSENFPSERPVTICGFNKTDNTAGCAGWVRYPIGVIRAFAAFGYAAPSGADLLFWGDLPDGAGLSSSAAIEVLTGVVLSALFNFPVTGQELALIGQFAENHFVGVQCGIMDQFASAMGRKDCAVLLNTQSLEYEYAPIDSSLCVVIANSGVKHSLASSAYNDRRHECEAALASLRSEADVPSLCSLTPQELFSKIHLIESGVCRRRAKHAVTENARTLAAAEALKKGSLTEFGELMRQSHESLRDDYEVSCPELDFLAETAWSIDGIYGARMTGGGFGGCTVNLVKRDCAQQAALELQSKYEQKFGRTPSVYIVSISDGAGKR